MKSHRRPKASFLPQTALNSLQPSTVCFTVGFHALTRLDNGQTFDPPVILQIEREGPLYCHPQDGNNPVAPKHVIKAAKLYEALSAIPRNNPVWEALRAFWAG